MPIFSNDFWYEAPTFATHALLAVKNFTAKTGQYLENFKPDFPQISPNQRMGVRNFNHERKCVVIKDVDIEHIQAGSIFPACFFLPKSVIRKNGDCNAAARILRTR